MNPHGPLRILLPAAILGLGLLMIVVGFIASLQISGRHLDTLTGDHLLNVGHAFASNVQSDLRNRNLAQVRSQVQRVASYNVVDLGVLFDDQGRVRYSSNSQILGRAINDTPFAALAGKVTRASDSMRPVQETSAGGTIMLLMIPVRLEPAPDEILSSRTGLLAMTFSLAPWQQFGRAQPSFRR